MVFERIIAVDPSLTCSGWALFGRTDQSLLAVGKIKAKKPPLSMAERLQDLQDRIAELYRRLELSQNDVLVCEAPTTMRDPRAALVVEQVRGLFETLARELRVRVPGRINPRSVQLEVLGLRGRQQKRTVVKEIAQEVTGRLYGTRLEELGLGTSESLGRHQDIVDAVLLGCYGISKIRQAESTGEPWERFFSQNERVKTGR